MLSCDPTERVDAPKTGRSVAHVLSLEAITRLLEAPWPEGVFGLRDRALLETLYATGGRVSEVVGLDLPALRLDLGVVRLLGKGQKERVVPIGCAAIAAIEAYVSEARPRLLSRARPDEPALFLSRGGRRIDRHAVWRRVRRRARALGITPGPIEGKCGELDASFHPLQVGPGGIERGLSASDIGRKRRPVDLSERIPLLDAGAEIHMHGGDGARNLGSHIDCIARLDLSHRAHQLFHAPHLGMGKAIGWALLRSRDQRCEQRGDDDKQSKDGDAPTPPTPYPKGCGLCTVTDSRAGLLLAHAPLL